MSKDRTTTSAVLVLCREKDRYEPWARIFSKAGAESVYVKKGGGEARKITSLSNLAGDLETWADVPDEVLAILVHAGDSDLWNGENEAQQVFWFNAPGEPSAEDDDLPVKRRTSAAGFDVTISDAEEILAYSAGERTEIPSCCEQKEEPEILPALSILCQGYLAAHAEAYDEDEDLWKPKEISDALKQMEWTEDHLAHTANGQPEKATQLDWWRSSFEDTDDLVGEAKGEWDDAASWSDSAVKDLLGRITDGEEPLQGEEERKVIANAYRELEKKLRGTS